MANRIGITVDKGGRYIDEPWVKKLAKDLLNHLELKDVELSLYFCSNETIRELNQEWRKIDRPTDVLSFSQLDEFDPKRITGVLGDVVIATEFAYQQALEAGQSFASDLIRLVIHGVLHLIGYDHELGESEAKSMRVEEDRLFKLLEGYCAGVKTAKQSK